MFKNLYEREKSFVNVFQNENINKEDVKQIIFEGKEFSGMPFKGKVEVGSKLVPITDGD